MKIKVILVIFTTVFLVSFKVYPQKQKEQKIHHPLFFHHKYGKIPILELINVKNHYDKANREKDTFLLPSETKRLRVRQAYLEEVYETGNIVFQVKKVPAKWENKSAVILGNYTEQVYKKRYPMLSIKQRTRIVLQDKAAVEDFSEFYLLDKEMSAIRIIKKDGQVIDLDLNDAVVVDKREKIPDRYYSVQKRYYKLAIKGLEVGDMIDYYQAAKANTYVGRLGAFPPFMSVLNDQYPIAHQKYAITLHKKFFLNCLPYNNAPKIDWMPPLEDKPRYFTYEIESRDIKEYKDEIWQAPYRANPAFKLQIMRSPKRFIKKGDLFLGERHIPKSEINEKEIGRIVSIAYNGRKRDAANVASYIVHHLKRSNKAYRNRKLTNKEDYLRDAYYCFRHLQGYYFGYSQTSFPSLEFAVVMREILKIRKIKSDILVVIPRTLGTSKDLLLREELTYMVYFKDRSKSHILSAFDLFSLHDELPVNMEGSDAFIVTPKKYVRSCTAKEFKLPVSSHKSNTLDVNFKVAIDENMENLKIKRETSVSGLMRKYYNLDVIIPQDFVDNDNEKYRTRPDYNRSDKEVMRKLIEWERKNIELRLNRLEEKTKNEYNLVEYKNFMLSCSGRYFDSSTLKFTEDFVITDLLKKAGNNYIFEAGKLLGPQIELSKKDFERKSDIYMPFARTYRYSISMRAPSGYNFEGIETLNLENETEVGGLKSVATVSEDNILQLDVSFYFNNNFEPVKNWSTLYNLVDLIWGYSQAKLLLVKRE